MGAFLRRERERRRRVRERKDRNMRLRQDAKDVIQATKISRKTAKKIAKIYDKAGMTPEEIAELNKLQPVNAAMAEQLQEQGVEVENPDDVVEVATKYNEQILDGQAAEIPTEDYDTAYLRPVEYWEHEEQAEDSKRQAKKRIFGAVVGGLTGALKVLTQQAKEKARTGQPLSKADKALLDLNRQGRQLAKQQAGDYLKNIAPLALLAAVLYIVVKK